MIALNMEKLELEILPQPNMMTCGPTCLHSLYRYYGEDVELGQVVKEVPMLEEGGTLAVLLGIHALRKGYKVHIYSYNLTVFDPSWFSKPGVDLAERLHSQALAKPHKKKLQYATQGYLEFLELGGKVHFEDLTSKLIRKYLDRRIPILTGLSATYLYHEPREIDDCTYDDLRGEPTGHFVVLSGYNREAREVLVADPLNPSPQGPVNYYTMPIARVIGAIFLGIVTYDANLLIIEPPDGRKGLANGDSTRRQ